MDMTETERALARNPELAKQIEDFLEDPSRGVSRGRLKRHDDDQEEQPETD